MQTVTEQETAEWLKVADSVADYCQTVGCNVCPFGGMHRHSACTAMLALAIEHGKKVPHGRHG